MPDVNISWRIHICTIEKNIQKNIGLLYQAKQLLDQESFKTNYFSYNNITIQPNN